MHDRVVNSATDNDVPSGWLYFAGTVLGLAGVMRLVDAFGGRHADA